MPFHRPGVHFSSLFLLAALASCGGAEGPSARSAADKAKGPNADSVSIGDTAAAQGGLTALGGAFPFLAISWSSTHRKRVPSN